MTTHDPRNYDHAALARLPEYQKARQAIDALGRRLDDLADRDLDRPEFVEAMADMARTSYAADCCSGCGRLTWPHAGRVEGRWLTGRYWCPACMTTWTCGYSTDFELLKGMLL